MAIKPRVAVLISGRGSNMEALVRAAADSDYPADIVLVAANKADAPGLEFARREGIEAVALPHAGFQTRAAFDAALNNLLRSRRVDIVCLAGFMRILGDDFIHSWHGRMLNIHPSLLPAFRGLDTHRRTLAAGCKVSGCTVHVVVPELDAGPIILQAAVPVLENDDEDRLAARILVQEHRIYPAALKLLASGRITIEHGRVRIAGTRPTDGALVSPAV